ncbi:TetR/AcrR family transcriptional regulator [Anianabacter salinae]|uniref:TetR/AcrR family transcriptional regulator n=1 Tax=Anianabacter salinae TaxID=2851023 RepID=UPI00225DD83F|nr:TetR/AcrR family transcriptional regulator [Anianabacter salinae]
MNKPLVPNEKKKQNWKQNPEAVKSDILRIATELFAANGLSGTRIDEIAARTETSKRMIYYYFGDKEGLYARVLEAAYAKVREGEKKLNLEGLTAADALAELVSFTFDHHRKSPEFIRMVMIENIHHAQYLKRSEVIRTVNVAAIDRLAEIIRRGEAEGAFRPGLDPVALHWQISALSFFNVSNRPTFSALFGPGLFGPEGQNALRGQAVDMILSHVKVNDP